VEVLLLSHRDAELVAIGAGPSNLALAVALEELAPAYLAENSLIIEQHGNVAWQRGMLLPWAQSQVSFLKDLVTLRDPRSKFTFINYLHSIGRLNQFVNLATFTPYRTEISGYLQWVAESLTKVQIEYGRRCVGIQPLTSTNGAIAAWLIRLADGSTVACRHLVIGTGRDAYIPQTFAALPAGRLIHSTDYFARMAGIDPHAPHIIVVIGGAQSAAEMLLDSYQTLSRARCIMVTRSIGLQSYDHSKFTNELYYPSFVDDFFAAPEATRGQVLSEMHRTNYGALDPELLDTLYRQIYLERLNGSDRLQIVTMADITAAKVDGPDIVLTLADRKSGRLDELRCSYVLLGTGFSVQMPGIVRDIATTIGVDEIAVNRAYSLIMPSNVTATCYLQGVNEATHGIADSLMSVLALRAQDIVTDILARGPADSSPSPSSLPDQAPLSQPPLLHRSIASVDIKTATANAGCAERVIVISIMKAGTHLIQELMVALGYGIYGQSRVTPDIRPVLDAQTRWRIARMVYGAEEIAKLEASEETAFIEGTDRAWDALAWTWQIKFGMPVINRYGRQAINTALVEQAQARTLASDFSETPAKMCWMLTEFDIDKIDGHFLQEWTTTGEPRIIFNYRDPRDVILSMVNFLSGNTKRGYGHFSEFQVFNKILSSKPTLEEKLTYALTDPSFPGYDAFAKTLWLLNHPNVCKVSFEELVGANGGGSMQAQQHAVARVLDFLGQDKPAESVASQLFSQDAFSFFKGQIGAWHDVFTPEHQKLFNDRLGHMLSLYGYE
jgi:L-ornithine N5-monooxygenase